jgi:hypothetical protein
MITTDNFFEQDHILENERARLEPLTEKYFELLLPIAMHTELWEFTGAKVRSEADFKRYFDTALAEKKTGSSYPPLPFTINSTTNMQAALDMAIFLS